MPDGSSPLVTVVAVCYNHATYLVETLNSILIQSYGNIELIIVDDASKDGSPGLIETWITDTNCNCIFVRNIENKGLCKTLNETLDIANGDFYKVIACDDILMPDAIKYLVNVFDRLSSDYALVYADVFPINEKGELVGISPFAERGWTTDAAIPSGELFVKLCEYCFIPAPSVMLRTIVVKKMRFDETLFIEDWDLWLRIAKKYLIKGVSRPIVKYRIHAFSMYQTKSPKFRDAELRIVEKHLGSDPKANGFIKDFIYRNSMLLYINGGLRPTYWLWRRFLIKKSPKNLFHVVSSFFVSTP